MAFKPQSEDESAMSEINVTPLGGRDAGAGDYFTGYRAAIDAIGSC